MTKKEIIKGLNEYCNCRVKCSDVHGVGLFAIRELKAHSSIFGRQDPMIGAIHFFTHLQIKKLPEEIKQLLYDYNLITDTGMYLPDYAWNYHHLCSYINHSLAPNVFYDVEINEFIAIRNIRKGEELLCNMKKDLENSKYKLRFLK
jgi:hypothetical protein|tara:strand:+ start:19 stop:456 length:438 start_codon:yes stop_codon:yes gene_type:complete